VHTFYIKDDNQCQGTIVHSYTTLVYSNSIITQACVYIYEYVCARSHQLTDCMSAGGPDRLSGVE